MRVLAGLLLAACARDPAPAPVPPSVGWQPVGPGASPLPPGEPLVLTSLPGGGPARACRGFPAPAGRRLAARWVWGLSGLGSNVPGGEATFAVAFLGDDGQPLRRPGGRERIGRLREDAPEREGRALVAVPEGAASALLCAELRGPPDAALTLGEADLSPLARGPAAPDLQNALIVVEDALRADALAPWRAPDAASPNLARLAERALVFERAWTQYTWTGPSVVSTLSSRFARSHGWVESWSEAGAQRPRPGADGPTLPAVLREAGYVTIGIHANGYLDWLDASDLGFDRWSYEAGASAVDRAVEEIGRWPGDGLPNLLYLHLMDVHDPLCPSAGALAATGVEVSAALFAEKSRQCPEGGLRQSAAATADGGQTPSQHHALYREVYRAGAWDADRHLGRLLAALEASGEAEHTLLVFTSDHGELLGEHGAHGHGPFVWEPLARVPLLLAGPGVAPGRRTEGVARLVDLAPTVLAALDLGERQPPAWQGRSLLRPPAEPALAVVEREGLVAFTLDGRGKRIEGRAQARGLGSYDLGLDPDERSPGAEDPLLRAAAEAWKAATPVAPPREGSPGPEEDLREALRGLGYLER